MTSRRHPSLERRITAPARLPRPIYARSESLRAGSWTPPHRHPWLQLSYAVAGVLAVRTRAGTFVAPRQWAVWIGPDEEHDVATRERAEMRSLYIDPAVAPWASPATRVVEVSPLARELIVEFGRLPAEYDEAGAAGRLVAVLLDQLAAAPEAPFSVPAPADPRLAAVSAGLQADPADRRTLSDWARASGASERTLARVFERETGLTFREWRQRLRLLSALTALERGSAVTAVALDCGFASPSAFIAAFRRRFGKTPGELFARGAPAVSGPRHRLSPARLAAGRGAR